MCSSNFYALFYYYGGWALTIKGINYVFDKTKATPECKWRNFMSELKRKAFGYSLFIICIFCYATTTLAANKLYKQQAVYLADEPLPKIVIRIKEQEPTITDEQIISRLKNTLVETTPEIAQKKFGIKWKDNGLSTPEIKHFKNLWTEHYSKKYPLQEGRFYPATVICKMGSNIGYGLFALNKIHRGQLIAEYTGDTVSPLVAALSSFNPYMSPDNVDATNSGNVARFAMGAPILKLGIDFVDTTSFLCHERAFSNLVFDDGSSGFEAMKRNVAANGGHIINHKALTIFGEKMKNKYMDAFHSEDVCINNGTLHSFERDTSRVINKPGTYLIANIDIDAFEQIIVDYGESYWSSWFRANGKKIFPCLFYKNGNMFCPSPEDEPNEL